MKTLTEWSLAFDQYYNNITSNKAPGLNLYEKSVFLSDAQDAVVLALYKGEPLSGGFESTEERSVYLAPLVMQTTLPYVGGGGSGSGSGSSWDETVVIDKDKSYVFACPADLLYRTLEMCHITTPDCGEVYAEVVPITQDEYLRTVRDPFKKQNARRVLRLVTADSTNQSGIQVTQSYTEIISDYPVVDYTVRYLKRPEPIILANIIPEGLTIRGKRASQPCLLDESLHSAILIEAVKLAKAVWLSK